MEKTIPMPKDDVRRADSQLRKLLYTELPRYLLLVALIAIYVAFGLINKNMFKIRNFFDIISTASITGVVAIGTMFSMCSGEMNFAAGAQATLAAMIVGRLMGVENPMPFAVAVAIGLLVCLIMGSGTTLLSQQVGVPSFIASLGIGQLINGIVKLVSDNKIMFSKYWGDSFRFLGQYRFALSKTLKVPVIMLVFLLLGFLAWLLMEKTLLGRHIFSVGVSKTTCRQVGLNVKRIKWYAMLLSSAVAGFGGIVTASRNFQISPAMGNETMLDATCAVMLGATFLTPGRPNVIGTMLASILVIVLNNGIYTIGASFSWRFVIQGLIFIISVGIIAMTNRGGLPTVEFGK